MCLRDPSRGTEPCARCEQCWRHQHEQPVTQRNGEDDDYIAYDASYLLPRLTSPSALSRLPSSSRTSSATPSSTEPECTRRPWSSSCRRTASPAPGSPTRRRQPATRSTWRRRPWTCPSGQCPGSGTNRGRQRPTRRRTALASTASMRSSRPAPHGRGGRGPEHVVRAHGRDPNRVARRPPHLSEVARYSRRSKIRMARSQCSVCGFTRSSSRIGKVRARATPSPPATSGSFAWASSL